MLTMVMQRAMNFWGQQYLESALGSILRRLCADKMMESIAAMRAHDKSMKDLDKGMFYVPTPSLSSHTDLGLEALVSATRSVWESIYNNRDQVPQCVANQM